MKIQARLRNKNKNLDRYTKTEMYLQYGNFDYNIKMTNSAKKIKRQI